MDEVSHPQGLVSHLTQLLSGFSIPENRGLHLRHGILLSEKLMSVTTHISGSPMYSFLLMKLLITY